MQGFTHESAVGETCEWYTPPSIFKALGLTFDLDVASPGKAAVPWIPAVRHITAKENGLVADWPFDDLVWMNPPYSRQLGRWVNRFIQHHNGMMLVFARTDTVWFHAMASELGQDDAICFVRRRIKFLRPNGVPANSPGAASILVGCGKQCQHVLKQAGRAGLGTVFFGTSNTCYRI